MENYRFLTKTFITTVQLKVFSKISAIHKQICICVFVTRNHVPDNDICIFSTSLSIDFSHFVVNGHFVSAWTVLDR